MKNKWNENKQLTPLTDQYTWIWLHGQKTNPRQSLRSTNLFIDVKHKLNFIFWQNAVVFAQSLVRLSLKQVFFVPLQINFPSGAQVLINNYKNLAFDISITPPEDDWSATEGLCGKFDGSTGNDLMYPDGHTDKKPNSHFFDNAFVDAWR